MAWHGVLLGLLMFYSGLFYTVSAQQNECITFGSGIIQMFNKTIFHLNSTCPVTMTHFSHASVDCFISVQRDDTGLIKKVEVLVNKVVTIVQSGEITVEGNSITLPYDHMYQSVYKYGIYTMLKSKVLPLYVKWHSVSQGVTSIWIQLNQVLVDGMTGMCGSQNNLETRAQLESTNIISDGICVTRDSQSVNDVSGSCSSFHSHARECLGKKGKTFQQLCEQSIYRNMNHDLKCAFFEEFIHSCNTRTRGPLVTRSFLRHKVSCGQPECPQNQTYVEEGPAFPPTCSSPQVDNRFLTRTCILPKDWVLNDRVKEYSPVKLEDCPCVYGARTYAPGSRRSSKCQTCECTSGKWSCSPNTCPPRCFIESFFVTTFDGKQYILPGKCSYVAARGLNWTVTILRSATDTTIEKLYLDIYQERYTFSIKKVELEETQIMDLSQTEHATVFWQSSMFIQVQTSFGMKMQVRVSPEIQMYLYLPPTVESKGLCGTNNNNTEDDFTTSSGIVENSAQSFVLSWALRECLPQRDDPCINTAAEMFAEEKCGQLTNTSGLFAHCHDYVPVNVYFDACVKRTCQSMTDLQDRICVGFANYAKACASQGINIGDWRAETGCTPICDSNQGFSYAMQACNRTCSSLSGPDPTCDVVDDPVEGCGCLTGTHLNTLRQCSTSSFCQCQYPGGWVNPGPVVIDGRQCMCENGKLQCSKACACPPGKICVHCAQTLVNTDQRTCDSLSKTFLQSMDVSCVSGCYCPEGWYEDHNGTCVTEKNCTCEFSGMVYASGESVESNCKICTCSGGRWNCEGESCPGVCEVFGNGQYKTFDSKWYRFDGQCQYTLVKDLDGLFVIRSESVPCCDEALTCSRSITVELQNKVTLTLRDMNITQEFLPGWQFRVQQLYSVHTVGLYFIISVPELGLIVTWDKQTRVKIELQARWKGIVRGLCGDFDGKLINDLLTSSSSVVSSMMEFGNSWKTAVPPCSDVTQEIFPCQRHSYCGVWAQRRCMILQSDTFKDCHLKVDPVPYYQACILESCSCEYEGKFLGFCTVVASYAEACTSQNICIKWRTPDLCPVYCDYYNEESQSSWHYEACLPQINTCGKNSSFTRQLEGCYPRCPAEMPYFDENTRTCTTLDHCTCSINNTVIGPGHKFYTHNKCCICEKGQTVCGDCITTTTTMVTTTTSTTTTTSSISSTTPRTTITPTSITITPLTTSTTVKIKPTATSTPAITTTGPVTTYTTPTATTSISTTSHVTTTLLTTTTPGTTATIISKTTTEEPMSITSLTPTMTETPQTTSTTARQLTTQLTKTPETSQPADTKPSTLLTTTTPETPQPTTSTSVEPTTTLTTATPETPRTTTTTAPPSSTPETITSERPYTTLSSFSEEPTTTATAFTSTKTTLPPATPSKEITTDMTYTFTMPPAEESTTLLTTPTQETPQPTTSTSVEPTTTLTTATPETPRTTTTTAPPSSTPETITSERPYTTLSSFSEEPTTTATAFTSTKTTLPPATPSKEITTDMTYTFTMPPAEESTTLLTTPTQETPQPTTSTSVEPTTTLTTATPETPRTTTTTAPPSSTPETITSERPYTTLSSFSEEPTTTATAFTSTKTTLPPATPSKEITTDMTYTFTMPPAEESTTLLTTPTQETPQPTTSTSVEPTTTLTTATPETPRTTTTTAPPSSTPETITSERPYTTLSSFSEEPTTTATAFTSTKTTLPPATPSKEITTDMTYTFTMPPAEESTTLLTTPTQETPQPTTSTSVEPTTTLTTATPETPRTTTTTAPPSSTPETITSERPYTTLSSFSEEPTTTATAFTSTKTTLPPATPSKEITTDMTYTFTMPPAEESTTLLTTPTQETPQPTTSTSVEPTTTLTTATPETPRTTTTTAPPSSTPETITSERPYTTLSSFSEEPTTTATPETPYTTTTPTSIITTKEHKTTTPLTTTHGVARTSSEATTVTVFTPQTTTQLIVTGPERSTHTNTQKLISTTTTQQPVTTTNTTKEPTTISLTPGTTTSIPDCKDLRRNQSWPHGAQWTENCYNKACYNGIIELRPIECPTPEVPICPRGQPELVWDKEGCCETWLCNCQCDIYGDPHYISFGNASFAFLKNCTYTLVKERTPRHHLSISVDNYDCVPSASCVKGIILKYRNNTVTLQVLQDEYMVVATLNQLIIQPPYKEGGIRFEKTDGEIFLYFDEIRSILSLSIWNTLQINLAMEHFYNNTQGQCGVCGGPSCVRRDGLIESEDCCSMTAYEWIEDDVLKPYCQHTQHNFPCVPDKPTPPPECSAPLCELLRHKVFQECSEDIDIETMVQNCRFDYCIGLKNSTVCSPLEYLADHCKKMGICVDWRNITYGICDISCPEGMIFDECRISPVDVCYGGERVPGQVSDGIKSGCFCPDNQVLAEKHKTICVLECTRGNALKGKVCHCKGPLGEPMPIGATWESNCHICTCNNQTRTEQCFPKPSLRTPTCDPGFTVSTDCCIKQRCVEKTCEHNGKTYQVGDTWTEHTRPCETFRCTTEGTEIERKMCPEQNCSEELRVWDEHHCCYTCNITCAVRLTTLTVSLENCTQEVVLPTCSGYCVSDSIWVRSGNVLQLELDKLSCRETNYEMKEMLLVCNGSAPTKYQYKHVTGCECRPLI